MSPALMALTGSLLAALAVVLAMLCASIARTLAADRLPRGAEPDDADPVADLGHRAARWTCLLVAAGVVAMLALERWAA
jgi:hypothetical protein